MQYYARNSTFKNRFYKYIMKEEILKILNNHSLLSAAVGEIAIKPDRVLIPVDIAMLQLDKNEAEKVAKICEKEIKNKLKIDKVMIVLTAEKNSAITHKAASTNEQLVSKNNPRNLLGEEILPVVGVKKIIAIASAKGGVGKSSLAANIAISLQRVGYKTALVDADIYGPSIPHLMNINSKPENKDGLLQPLIAHNVKCISIGSLIDTASAGVWRGPMITKILYQLIRSVDWRSDGNDVDVMIIDMPPGTGDVYLSLAEKFPLNGVVIVSTPQSLAVIDVVRSIDCFNKLKIPIFGIIQNMAYLQDGEERRYIFGRDGAKNLADKMQINFLGEVPMMQEISDANESRTPIVAAQPSCEAALLIGRIAEKIMDYV